MKGCLHRFCIAIVILCAFLYFSNVERFKSFNEAFNEAFVDIKYGDMDVGTIVLQSICGLLLLLYCILWLAGATKRSPTAM